MQGRGCHRGLASCPGLLADVPGEAAGGDLEYPGKQNGNGTSNKIPRSTSLRALLSLCSSHYLDIEQGHPSKPPS